MSASITVSPGDVVAVLVAGTRAEVGSGVYVLPGKSEVRASLLGRVVVETLQDGTPRYNVVAGGESGAAQGIAVGDKVTCRVTRIAANQCFVDIISVNEGAPLSVFPKGTVRREDVRLANVDSLVMHECFRPGDVLRAAVLSLGDARQYFLSTSESTLGVTAATSVDGNPLAPVSWSEMRDSVTGKSEPRKVAKPSA